MDTFEAINKRASVREYSEKAIPKDVLEKLVDAGRRAPTARHVEPWEFIVVTDKSTLSRIAGMAPNGSFIKGAAAAIVIICEETKYYLEDGCAATENILLQVADLGLGACWIAGDKKPYCDDIVSMLGAPKNTKLISIISLGWPKKDVTQTERRPLNELLHWEKF